MPAQAMHFGTRRPADARAPIGAVVFVVAIAHDKSPWSLDWVPRVLIGRERVLFPENSGQALERRREALTNS